MNRWSGAILGLCLLALSAAAQTTQSAAGLDDLIRQLGDEDWHVRQSAQDALVKLGVAAEPTLRATTQAAQDEETRSRAMAALSQIAEFNAVRPSVITLHLHDATPQQIFESLCKQAEIPLDSDFSAIMQQWNRQPTSIDLDDVSFWKAARVIHEKTGLALLPMNDRVRINSGPPESIYSQEVGPYLITPRTLHRTLTVNLTDPPVRNGALSMQIEFKHEPRIHLARIGSAIILEATDDHGNSLLGPAVDDSRFFRPDAGFVAPLSVNLVYPQNNPGTRLATMRGYIRIAVILEEKDLVFQDLLNKPEQSLPTPDGVVTLKSVTQQNEQVQVEMEILITPKPDQPPAMTFADTMTRLSQSVRLLDADNHPYTNAGTSSNSSANNQVRLTMNFVRGANTNLGPPDHLMYRVLTGMKETRVPFQFDNLPLP